MDFIMVMVLVIVLAGVWGYFCAWLLDGSPWSLLPAVGGGMSIGWFCVTLLL